MTVIILNRVKRSFWFLPALRLNVQQQSLLEQSQPFLSVSANMDIDKFAQASEGHDRILRYGHCGSLVFPSVFLTFIAISRGGISDSFWYAHRGDDIIMQPQIFTTVINLSSDCWAFPYLHCYNRHHCANSAISELHTKRHSTHTQIHFLLQKEVETVKNWAVEALIGTRF